MDNLLKGVIEETKKYGAMTALHRQVATKLWTAMKNCENAQKCEGGMRYVDFAECVAGARLCLEDAEANFHELERMLNAESPPPKVEGGQS